MAIRENYNQDQTVITYEQTGRSMNTNELGMREMQARVYEKRNEQKQLMKDDICVELAGYLMDATTVEMKPSTCSIPLKPSSAYRTMPPVSTTRVPAMCIASCRAS